MKTIDDRLRDVARAIKALKLADTDRSRRFWRKRFSYALRMLKADADEAFPAPRREVKSRARLTDAQKRGRLEREGWTTTRFLEATMAKACAEAGVRVRSVARSLYVPAWAEVIGPDVPKLRAARLDRQKRKHLVRKAELTKQAKENGIPEKAIHGVVKAALQLDKVNPPLVETTELYRSVK